MRHELELKLKNKYPDLFTDLMRPEFECGAGWVSLLDEVFEELSKYGVSIRLVKEKFGGLVIYFVANEEDYEAVSSIVSRAEARSYMICEVCEKNGKLRKEVSHIRTLCDDCYELAKSNVLKENDNG